MDLQQRTQIANMLSQRLGVGLQGVGVGTGAAVPLSSQIASSITGGGAALASGAVGSANAWTGGLGGLGNAAASGASNLALINALQQGGGFNVANAAVP